MESVVKMSLFTEHRKTYLSLSICIWRIVKSKAVRILRSLFKKANLWELQDVRVPVNPLFCVAFIVQFA